MSLPPFERAVAAHGPTVLRVCRALLGPTDAEDAWSETFLAALRAYPRLRPDSDVRAWLVTIAHRKAIDQLRARGRRATTRADVPDRPGPDRQVDGPDAALVAALAALPPKQQGAVVHHHLAGLPYAQVAALLETTEAAARRAAADGMAALRRTYRPEEQG